MIKVCRLQTKMRGNLQIISILLSVTNFDVISAIGGSTPVYCENFQFFGNCIKEELCLCYLSHWYVTSFADIRSFSSEINAFSDICDFCSSPQPIKCINESVHWLVIDELRGSNLIHQITEANCLQMLTDTLIVSQTTTLATAITGELDMTSTAYTTTSTNEQTTRSEASTTGVSLTTTLSTATSGGQDMTSTAYTTTSTNEQTTRSEASTTGTMCPCQCEYFDKIGYWAQEINQRRQYEELSQKLAEIKGILKMETKNLSSFVNKKISAADDRPSVVATGYFGAGIMTIVLAGIVLLDLPVIIQQARLLFRDIQRLCARAY